MPEHRPDPDSSVVHLRWSALSYATYRNSLRPTDLADVTVQAELRRLLGRLEHAAIIFAVTQGYRHVEDLACPRGGYRLPEAPDSPQDGRSAAE
jgi:hypothetical protein